MVTSREDLAAEISRILFRVDPIGINFTMNTDEYDLEAAAVAAALRGRQTVDDVRQLTFETFVQWFGSESAGPIELYGVAAVRIWSAWQRACREMDGLGPFPPTRLRFEEHAAALVAVSTLEITETQWATTLVLRPRNPRAVGVLLYLAAGDHGTVALDDPACVPTEIGDDIEADLRAVDETVDEARDGRVTAFHLGSGGCVETRRCGQTSRSWVNAFPWPGWRRRATRVDYEPYS